MHYDPIKNDHGLSHSPFNALIAPRPIGWISTLSPTGIVNLAPYSFFNAVSGRPPFVMFASSTPKHSRFNAEQSGEFVANLATGDLKDEVVETSRPVADDVSEAELARLALAPSRQIRTPRVARARAALECRYVKTVELHDRNGALMPAAIVIGEVVDIFIDDAIIVDGRVDLTLAKPLARLGYLDYCVVEEVFEMGVFR
jgi:flavin reductase (DIM6/NTAB) family NADH-FMN oxidoreductase RutF